LNFNPLMLARFQGLRPTELAERGERSRYGNAEPYYASAITIDVAWWDGLLEAIDPALSAHAEQIVSAALVENLPRP
jgi:hypothetical protein